MKYQKLINLLGNTPNLPTTFGTKKWVEINKNGLGIYNTNSQIKLKTSMLNSGLCDYSDVYTLVKGTVSIAEKAGDKQEIMKIKMYYFKTALHLH